MSAQAGRPEGPAIEEDLPRPPLYARVRTDVNPCYLIRECPMPREGSDAVGRLVRVAGR